MQVRKKVVGVPEYPLSTQVKQNYRYGFHSKFTHISKDLLTLTTDEAASKCVADRLGQGLDHREILNSTYYLSPSLSLPEKADSYYIEMYQKFMMMFPSMKWKKELTREKYSELNALWQKIRVGL